MKTPLYKFVVIFMILLFNISCIGKTTTIPDPMIHKETSTIHQEASTEMTDTMELHHWIAYRAAKDNDAPKVNHHVGLALILAKDPRHRSSLDGLIREHVSEEHFVHTQQTLKEWLGNRPEPELTLEKLEVKLAMTMLKERNIDDARMHLQICIASGRTRESSEKALNALTQGDVEQAQRLLAELMEKGPF